MYMTGATRRRLAGACLLGVIVVSCGGLPDVVFDPDSEEAQSEELLGDLGAATSGAEAGPVTLTPDPGQTWAEVDGERIVYQAAGSLHYECEIGDDRVSVNYQTPEGHDLNIMLGLQDDGWYGTGTFKPAGDEIVQYGFSIPQDGTIGLGEDTMSFEGISSRMVDFEAQDATDVDTKVGVNCGLAGGNPTATIGGTELVFAMSGAQSINCEISADNIDVQVNRLSLDDLQLTFDARSESGDWFGLVSVIAGDDDYLGVVPENGTLQIDGQKVTYEGSFVHTSDADPDLEEELDGTATATCG